MKLDRERREAWSRAGVAALKFSVGVKAWSSGMLRIPMLDWFCCSCGPSSRLRLNLYDERDRLRGIAACLPWPCVFSRRLPCLIISYKCIVLGVPDNFVSSSINSIETQQVLATYLNGYSIPPRWVSFPHHNVLLCCPDMDLKRTTPRREVTLLLRLRFHQILWELTINLPGRRGVRQQEGRVVFARR